MKSKCPSCGATHTEIAPACAECGFGYSVLEEYYGKFQLRNNAVEARLLTDNAGILNTSERKQCKRLLMNFSKRFPGVFFTVYLDSAKDHEEADSKSLWILNKADFSELPDDVHSQYGIILYVDANKRTSALSYGSGLSPYLSAKNSFSFLKASHPEFYRGRYLNAIKKTVNKVSSHLSVKCPVIKKAHPHS